MLSERRSTYPPKLFAPNQDLDTEELRLSVAAEQSDDMSPTHGPSTPLIAVPASNRARPTSRPHTKYGVVPRPITDVDAWLFKYICLMTCNPVQLSIALQHTLHGVLMLRIMEWYSLLLIFKHLHKTFLEGTA